MRPQLLRREALLVVMASCATMTMPAQAHVEYQRSAQLMGSAFSFTIVDTAGSQRAETLLDLCVGEVARIERLLSDYIDTSEVGQVNALAGVRPVRVSGEVYDLTDRALRISRITEGAFDITFRGMSDLWTFEGQDVARLPDPSLVEAYLRSVGRELVSLQKQTIFLTMPGMSIGYGAIGKGYAADKVKELMQFFGISSGLVNAGGDITAWGLRADSTAWQVGIADPEDPGQALLWLPVRDASVATSGSYERYFTHAGERYAHVIDPRSGYPVRNIKSVTIINASGELADALATAVFVMGVTDGLAFIEKLPNTEGLIIDAANALHLSSGIDLNPDP
ncbi:MAG: FAD:protein FMN transferase [Saprospiraceae bacterium]|nr:FAD:protein FMN transferase [Saprospiraceae bacterium]